MNNITIDVNRLKTDLELNLTTPITTSQSTELAIIPYFNNMIIESRTFTHKNTSARCSDKYYYLLEIDDMISYITDYESTSYLNSTGQIYAVLGKNILVSGNTENELKRNIVNLFDTYTNYKVQSPITSMLIFTYQDGDDETLI